MVAGVAYGQYQLEPPGSDLSYGAAVVTALAGAAACNQTNQVVQEHTVEKL